MATLRFLRSLALLLALAGTAAADEPKEEVTDKQRAEHLALMQSVAKSIQLLADPQQAISQLAAAALLRSNRYCAGCGGNQVGARFTRSPRPLWSSPMPLCCRTSPITSS